MFLVPLFLLFAYLLLRFPKRQRTYASISGEPRLIQSGSIPNDISRKFSANPDEAKRTLSISGVVAKEKLKILHDRKVRHKSSSPVRPVSVPMDDPDLLRKLSYTKSSYLQRMRSTEQLNKVGKGSPFDEFSNLRKLTLEKRLQKEN